MKKETLKNWFSDGKKPTGQQFSTLIDSFVHKDEISTDKINGIAQFTEQINTELNNINGRLEENSTSIGAKANLDASNLTPPEVEAWRNTLGVEKLPTNNATIDLDGQLGNVHTKEQVEQLLTANNTNIATSNLTTTASGGVTQGADYTWNINNKNLTYLNEVVPYDKYEGRTFFRMGKGFINLSDSVSTTWGANIDKKIEFNRYYLGIKLDVYRNNVLKSGVWCMDYGLELKGVDVNTPWDTGYTHRLVISDSNGQLKKVRNPLRWFKRLESEIKSTSIPLNRPGMLSDFGVYVSGLGLSELYKVRICILGDTRLVCKAIKHNDRVGYLGYVNKLIKANENFYSIIDTDTTNVGNIDDNRDIFSIEFIIKLPPTRGIDLYPCFSRQDGIEGYGSILPGSFIEVEEIITK